MVDKKFSDFDRVAFLNGNDLLPTEIPNTTNRAISFADLFNQIKTDLLTASTTDCGVFKYIAWQHSGGVPIDLPNHLVYADGRALLRSDNGGLVGKFIDFIYDKQQLRELFDIPVDKSQMTMPDLRNKHLVGRGDANPIFSDITSKSVDFTGEIKKEYTLEINKKTGLKSTGSFFSSDFEIANQTVDDINYPLSSQYFNKILRANNKAFTWTSQAGFSIVGLLFKANVGLPLTTYIEDHKHDAALNFTKLELNKNTSLIDSVNRVPAFALFLVLDINVSGFVLNPDADGNPIIQIGDVIGLQDALDSKADTSDLDNINANFLKYSNFGIKYTKTGLTTSIPTSPTALTNLINLINVNPAILNYATDRAGNDKEGISLINTTNGLKLPVVDGLANYGVGFNIRIFGSLSGGANTTREVVLSLKRISDNSTIASASLIETTDSNFNGRVAIINSYIKGATDPFVTGGFYIDLLNNSGATLTIAAIELLIIGA
jgi:hypothetical protein